jgi:hypothetical protein
MPERGGRLPASLLPSAEKQTSFADCDQTAARDDEEERRARPLLLGKAAVLAHRFERPLAAEMDEKRNSTFPRERLESTTPFAWLRRSWTEAAACAYCRASYP